MSARGSSLMRNFSQISQLNSDLDTLSSSKYRQKKFHRHFKQVDQNERVIDDFSCALVGDVLLQGHLYVTENRFGFHSNVFGYTTKKKTARIFPNAVGVVTKDNNYIFGSLLSRDATFLLMQKVWQQSSALEVPSRNNRSFSLCFKKVDSADCIFSNPSTSINGSPDSSDCSTNENEESTFIDKVRRSLSSSSIDVSTRGGSNNGWLDFFSDCTCDTPRLLLIAVVILVLLTVSLLVAIVWRSRCPTLIRSRSDGLELQKCHLSDVQRQLEELSHKLDAASRRRYSLNSCH